MFFNQDYGVTAFVSSVDAVFYGRKSYELFGRQIPDTVQFEEDKELWRAILSKKAYVFSSKHQPKRQLFSTFLLLGVKSELSCSK